MPRAQYPEGVWAPLNALTSLTTLQPPCSNCHRIPGASLHVVESPPAPERQRHGSFQKFNTRCHSSNSLYLSLPVSQTVGLSTQYLFLLTPHNCQVRKKLVLLFHKETKDQKGQFAQGEVSPNPPACPRVCRYLYSRRPCIHSVDTTPHASEQRWGNVHGIQIWEGPKPRVLSPPCPTQSRQIRDSIILWLLLFCHSICIVVEWIPEAQSNCVF